VNGLDPQLALLDAVIYGDVFDCAVTLEEAHDFSRQKIDLPELETQLEKFVQHGVIGVHDGFYHLPGRVALAIDRPERIRRARKLRRRSLQVARLLRHLPFVRGLYLTGSVAVDHAERDADVDLLIVVADGRLGSVFVELGPLARMVSRQVFCPNYYMSQRHLEIERHSHYVAREIAQAQPLISDGNPLIAANAWVREELPNLRAHEGVDARRSGSLLQRTLEWPLAGTWGGRLEERARTLVRRRLEKHYSERGWTLPENVRDEFERGEALRFHASDKVEDMRGAIEERTRSVEAALERMRSSTPQATGRRDG
jgi:hypothetical protein